MKLLAGLLVEIGVDPNRLAKDGCIYTELPIGVDPNCLVKDGGIYTKVPSDGVFGRFEVPL